MAYIVPWRGGTRRRQLRQSSTRPSAAHRPSVAKVLSTTTSLSRNLDAARRAPGVPRQEREEETADSSAFSRSRKRQPNHRQSSRRLEALCRLQRRCIMHEPDILFLDEPTSGVDPLARRAFWTMINRLADTGAASSSPPIISKRPEGVQSPRRSGRRRTAIAEAHHQQHQTQQSGHLIQCLSIGPRPPSICSSRSIKAGASLFSAIASTPHADDAPTSPSARPHSNSRIQRPQVASARESQLLPRRRLHLHRRKSPPARQKVHELSMRRIITRNLEKSSPRSFVTGARWRSRSSCPSSSFSSSVLPSRSPSTSSPSSCRITTAPPPQPLHRRL